MLLLLGTKKQVQKSEFEGYHKICVWFTFFFIPLIPISHEYIPLAHDKKKISIPILWSNFILNFFFLSGLISVFGVFKWVLIFIVDFLLTGYLATRPHPNQLIPLLILILAELTLLKTISDRKKQLQFHL